MRCYGNYKNNEMCDLCKIVNYAQFNECKNTEDKKSKDRNLLNEIKENCPYLSQCWDEYDKFDGCTLNGHNGRFTDVCEPKTSCLTTKK
jgi:hypothetical protein